MLPLCRAKSSQPVGPVLNWHAPGRADIGPNRRHRFVTRANPMKTRANSAPLALTQPSRDGSLMGFKPS